MADDDYDAAVAPLADGVFPYGNDTPLSRQVQAVLVHYGIPKEDAALLAQEDLHLKKDFKFANPDGNAEQRQTYEDSVGPIKKAVRRSRMKAAVRRILLPDPFAAIVPPPSSVASRSSSVTPLPSSKKRKAAVDGAPVARRGFFRFRRCFRFRRF